VHRENLEDTSIKNRNFHLRTYQRIQRYIHDVIIEYIDNFLKIITYGPYSSSLILHTFIYLILSLHPISEYIRYNDAFDES